MPSDEGVTDFLFVFTIFCLFGEILIIIFEDDTIGEVTK